MKNLIIYILLLLPFVTIGQRGESGQRGQKIHAAKIGMITERLNLTPEQAPQFWAVYNEYENKRIELKKNIRRTMDEASSLTSTDEKIVAAQKQVLVLRRKETDLEEEYMSKILKTITPRQFSELKRTEANFNKMLLERLNEKENN
ncbi:hypothetical protein EMA8858_00997 [Emticicia aquatica]|jgi:Spy/CpxP family protein refolding chaperone|uniref:LTXXQ motif family protein n=1 Tax=Emticicia aquatica TaxID=1681835 RepID=A0ABM9AMC1_9BACT|nr:Spy/CpxP family protein refolding chaperone [Emticicia aquatica]CAH0994884.1 hypothetical protein EMA8858_00997 [Emticicia aquatica]